MSDHIRHQQRKGFRNADARRVATGYTPTCGKLLAMAGNKVGRPSKGDRHVTSLRVPRDVYEQIKGDADTAGVSVVDWLNHVVWTYYDLDPALDPVRAPVHKHQQQLDMTA